MANKQLLNCIAQEMNVYGHNMIKSERIEDSELMFVSFYDPFNTKPTQTIIFSKYGTPYMTITKDVYDYHNREQAEYTIAFNIEYFYYYDLIVNLDKIFESFINMPFESCFGRFITNCGNRFDNLTTMFLYFSDNIATHAETFITDVRYENALDEDDYITLNFQFVMDIL